MIEMEQKYMVYFPIVSEAKYFWRLLIIKRLRDQFVFEALKHLCLIHVEGAFDTLFPENLIICRRKLTSWPS